MLDNTFAQEPAKTGYRFTIIRKGVAEDLKGRRWYMNSKVPNDFGTCTACGKLNTPVYRNNEDKRDRIQFCAHCVRTRSN